MSRWRYRILLVAVAGLAIAALLPADGWIIARCRELSDKISGDVRRELRMLQQYGQLSAMVLASVIVALLDPARRRRLLDWWLAGGAAFVACLACKVTLGRARPDFNDPLHFTPPWQTYVGSWGASEHPPLYAWQIFHKDAVEIWSMPSSHTALAVVMSLFLTRLYPRFAPLGVVMVVIVGGCRVLFVEHYATDVVAGALVGYLAAQPIIDRAPRGQPASVG